MASSHYRIGYLIIMVYLLTLLVIWLCFSPEQHYFVAITLIVGIAVMTNLYRVPYLIHFGKGKKFRRTFSFTTCSLLTLTGLKWMGARDYLSVLAYTFAAILKIFCFYGHLILFSFGYTYGFFFKSTREINIFILTGRMNKREYPELKSNSYCLCLHG